MRRLAQRSARHRGGRLPAGLPAELCTRAIGRGPVALTSAACRLCRFDEAVQTVVQDALSYQAR
jgi:hypothetical protein